MPFTWNRVGGWVIALVVGAVFGVAGTMTHATTWGPVPVGVIVALIGCLALLIAIRALTGDRIAAFAAGLGMGAVTYALSFPGPGGSVVLPDDVLSLVWSVGLAAVAVLVIAWPSGIRAAARTDE